MISYLFGNCMSVLCQTDPTQPRHKPRSTFAKPPRKHPPQPAEAQTPPYLAADAMKQLPETPERATDKSNHTLELWVDASNTGSYGWTTHGWMLATLDTLDLWADDLCGL